MEGVLYHIENHSDEYIETLKEIVAIPSVSAEAARRPDIRKMIEWMRDRLNKIGATTEIRETGVQTLPDGSKIEFPPCVLGILGSDPSKKTVLLYGHLDVMPAAKIDGWDSEPFELLKKDDGKLVGRGSTDDKGPCLGWVHAIEAYQACGVELPVNIRFIFEGMEEQGSAGFKETCFEMGQKKDPFFQGIEFICISDSYWLGTKTPCLSYGLRGLAHFWVQVKCASQDLHSGSAGGIVNEAMSDLCWLFGQLRDVNGKILVPGILDEVRPVKEQEMQTYKDISDFDWEERKKLIGTNKLTAESPAESLMNTWRFPTMSIHGFEGAFSGEGVKTVIPATVTGKLSVRLVPDMTFEGTKERVVSYLEDLWSKRGSSNDIKITPSFGGKWWIEDPEGPNYAAARRAIKKIYNVEPDLIREGGSIPVTIVISEAVGKPACLLPMGRIDDGAHGQNEKLDLSNYIQGTKVMAQYLAELAL